MFALLSSLLRLLLLPRSVREIALENLALRQQLAVLKRRRPRPHLQIADRIFWVWLSTVWSPLRQALMIVCPETVVSCNRKGFRLFWTWISRRKRSCRPGVSTEIKVLIRRMAEADPFWGRPGFMESDPPYRQHYHRVEPRRVESIRSPFRDRWNWLA